MLRSKGAGYRRGPDDGEFVVDDGILITGQNPPSSAKAARMVLAKAAGRRAEAA